MIPVVGFDFPNREAEVLHDRFVGMFNVEVSWLALRYGVETDLPSSQAVPQEPDRLDEVALAGAAAADQHRERVEIDRHVHEAPEVLNADLLDHCDLRRHCG